MDGKPHDQQLSSACKWATGCISKNSIARILLKMCLFPNMLNIFKLEEAMMYIYVNSCNSLDTDVLVLNHRSHTLNIMCPWFINSGYVAHCSPLSFFDLLLEGACFFFKVWAWPCSLHRRSWKLINFHIMKAWVRQMAARTVTLIERGNSQ